MRSTRLSLHVLSVILTLAAVGIWPAAASAQAAAPCTKGGGVVRRLCDVDGAYLKPGSKDRQALLKHSGMAAYSLQKVMASPRQQMSRGSCGQQWVGIAKAASYCWPGEAQTNAWMPQGIAGEAESGWRAASGQELTVMSAYAKVNDSELARLQFIDADTGRYVQVTPLEPFSGKRPGCTYRSGVSLCQLESHAGGLAWRGKYLYMAGTNDVHVFDLTRFIATEHGYGLPEVARYYEHVPGSFRVSFVSVDASRNELVVGTYDRTASTQRMLHWPLKADGSLAHTYASYGVAVVGSQFATRLQGVAVYNGQYFLSQSGSGSTRDRLYVASVNGGVRSFGWVRGAEDLYLDPDRGLLWGGGEFTGARSVVAVRVDRYML